METINQGAEVQTVDAPTPAVQDEIISMSKSDFEKQIQSISDSRVTSAIKTHEAKLTAKFMEKLEQEKAEAVKIATMSEKEKADHLAKQYAESLKQKEREITSREIKLKTTEYLAKNQIDLDVLDFVLAESEEETQGKLEKLTSIINRRIESEKTTWIKSNSDQSTKSEGLPSGTKKVEWKRSELASPEGRKSYNEAMKQGLNPKIIE